MSAGKKVISVRQVRQPTRHDGFQCLAKSIEEHDRSIFLGLCVVVFVRFSKGHRDCLSDLCGSVTLVKESVEGSVEVWQ